MTVTQPLNAQFFFQNTRKKTRAECILKKLAPPDDKEVSKIYDTCHSRKEYKKYSLFPSLRRRRQKIININRYFSYFFLESQYSWSGSAANAWFNLWSHHFIAESDCFFLRLEKECVSIYILAREKDEEILCLFMKKKSSNIEEAEEESRRDSAASEELRFRFFFGVLRTRSESSSASFLVLEAPCWKAWEEEPSGKSPPVQSEVCTYIAWVIA